jgi:hypothetical protein
VGELVNEPGGPNPEGRLKLKSLSVDLHDLNVVCLKIVTTRIDQVIQGDFLRGAAS